MIYLGAGWALTARHVGVGEIFLEDEVFLPDVRTRHTLLNVNGTAADAIVFRLDPDADLPDLPILPLSKSAPLPGEEILVIGFGRERRKVIEWHDDGEIRFGFEWTQRGQKRWGTNRVVSNNAFLVQPGGGTHALTFAFDPASSEGATRYEVQAAVGDSGGAVFVKRDDQWLLAGMMTSISANPGTPESTATYGDTTFAADISVYRSEILRWARPHCANEEDDDGDGKIDFPLDPDCDSPSDALERDAAPAPHGIEFIWEVAPIGLGVFAVVMFVLFRHRVRRACV